MKSSKIFYILYYIFLVFFVASQVFYFMCETQSCQFMGILVFLGYQIFEPIMVLIFIWLFFNSKHIFITTLPLAFAVLFEYFFKGTLISSDYFNDKTIYFGSIILQNIPTYEILFVLNIIQICFLFIFRKRINNFIDSNRSS